MAGDFHGFFCGVLEKSVSVLDYFGATGKIAQGKNPPIQAGRQILQFFLFFQIPGGKEQGRDHRPKKGFLMGSL